MAYNSQGCNLFWSASTSYSTAQAMGEVVDFSGPGGQSAVIDITSLQSTAKEKLIGLRDEGQLSVSLHFNATNAGQAALLADRASRTKRACAIKFSDTATQVAKFQGYCLGFTIGGAVDDKVSANAVIEIDGPVSYTTG